MTKPDITAAILICWLVTDGQKPIITSKNREKNFSCTYKKKLLKTMIQIFLISILNGYFFECIRNILFLLAFPKKYFIIFTDFEQNENKVMLTLHY